MTNLSRMMLAVLLIVSTAPIARAAEARADVRVDGFTFAATDWPWWRGPGRNGIAAADQNPPTKWSRTQNIRWKAPVPGRGHGSAIVVGQQVFIAAADHERGAQSILCFDRDTGRRLWQTDVHKGGLVSKANKKATQASSTPACDGKRVFINFLNRGAIYTTALDRDGNKLWQTKISDYVLHQGYGSSPAIYKSLVIVSADNKGGGAIAALNRADGNIVWKHSRPKTPNYASPVILNIAGRDQLLFIGCDLVASYAPLTGKRLWRIEGATTECVSSTVTDGQLMFTSGGYPRNHVSAVRADGSGKVVWENGTRVYVPSMLCRGGYLYAVSDAGVAICWKAATGQTMWKSRLGGTFDSSPVLVGDKVYAINERGQAFIFKAKPDAFEEVGRNQLGDEVFATPTICGGRIYLRVAERIDDKRQEFLYCIGASE